MNCKYCVKFFLNISELFIQFDLYLTSLFLTRNMETKQVKIDLD